MPQGASASLHLIFPEGMMKQGVIVYLLGGGEPPEGLLPGTLYKGFSQPTGSTEVMVSQPGILELDEAWQFLLSQGCETIFLLVTQAEPDRLHPLHHLVRLTGVTRVVYEPSPAGGPGRVLH
jgi:hypothetical protein